MKAVLSFDTCVLMRLFTKWLDRSQLWGITQTSSGSLKSEINESVRIWNPARRVIIHYAMTLPIKAAVNQISRPFYQTLIRRQDWENKQRLMALLTFTKVSTNSSVIFCGFFLGRWYKLERWFMIRRRGRVLHAGAAQINCDTCMFNYKPPSWNEINYYLYRLWASVASHASAHFPVWNFPESQLWWNWGILIGQHYVNGGSSFL